MSFKCAWFVEATREATPAVLQMATWGLFQKRVKPCETPCENVQLLNKNKHVYSLEQKNGLYGLFPMNIYTAHSFKL